MATILCFSFCCCVFGGVWSWKLLCCHSQIIRWTGIDSIKSAPKETPTAQTRPTGPVQGRQFGEVTPRRRRLGGIMAACVSHQRRTSGAEKWRHHGNNEKCFCDALKWGKNSMQRLKQFLVADCKHVYICCKVLTWGFIEDWLTFEASSGH